MRILQVAHSIYPYANTGVPIYTYMLSRELVKRGHNVLVAAPFPLEKQQALSSDIPVYPLPTNQVDGGNITRSNRKLIWSYLREAIYNFKPEIIHVQHLVHIGWETLSDIQKIGIPFVLSLHDYWYLCRGGRRMCQGSALKCAIYCSHSTPAKPFHFLHTFYQARRHRDRCVSLLNRIAAPLVSPSYRTAEIYKQTGVTPDRIVIQPLGIDISELRCNSFLTQGHPVRFGYIGSLDPGKGIHILVRAFQKLHTSATLHIFGGGSAQYVESLQELSAGTAVYFYGDFDHKEISRVLSMIDVVVIPSTCEETYGIVVQEALAAHKIVIASAIGALKERIFHGVNGFLFSPGDVDALARQMSSVAENYHDVVKQMVFELSQQHISTDGEQFVKLYTWTANNWANLCYKRVLPIEWELEELANMLSGFIREEKALIHLKLKQEFQSPGFALREVLDRVKPNNNEDVKEFLRITACYLYNMVIAQRNGERLWWQKIAVSLLIKYGVKTLLDFGGGCVLDLPLFSRMGIDCTVYDVGLINTKFARVIAAHYGIRFEILDRLPSGKKFDAVFCAEVFEHLFDSLRRQDMHKLLVPGGILILTQTSTQCYPPINGHPLHLESLGMTHSFVQKIEKLGFKFVEVLNVSSNNILVFQNKAQYDESR